MAELNQAKQFLKAEFLREAHIVDLEKGYVSAASFNLRMKPSVLKAGATLIVEEFQSDGIEVIHGIPHSGVYLATAVSLTMPGDVRLHSSRKDQHIPAVWKDVCRQEIRSYTSSKGGIDVFSGITLSFVKKGDRVLLIDDVCATGQTAYQIIQGLQEKGVEVVGFAVMFDKLFQGGLEYVRSLGVKTFSCVTIKVLNDNDRVILQP
ncbi:MAG TPA: phosphoribosyltransferase family protein [Patescibacteria group bacterium]